MKAKRKTNNRLVIAVFSVVIVALAGLAAVFTVLALSNLTVNTAINMRFVAVDIDARVIGEYKIKGESEWTQFGSVYFDADQANEDIETATMSPNNGNTIELNGTKDSIEFRYTFRNFGDAYFTGLVLLDVVENDNMKIEFKYNEEDYSQSQYGLVVKGLSDPKAEKLTEGESEEYTEMSYTIKVSAKNRSSSWEYSNVFNWELREYKPAADEEVINLSAATFVKNTGETTYSASYNADADISVGGVSATGIVSAQSSPTIENLWYVPSKFGSANVTKIVKGDDLPTNTKVVITDGITTISPDAFAESIGLLEIKFGKGITTIPDKAFANCTSLVNIDIPDNVTSIGYQAFYGCTSLTSAKMSNNITSVGTSVFGGCTKLSEVVLSESLTGISSGMFSSCSSLKSITIPDGVTSLLPGSFATSGLESINIPKNLKSISSYAFSGCTSLTSVEFEITTGWYDLWTGSAFDVTGSDIIEKLLSTKYELVRD